MPMPIRLVAAAHAAAAGITPRLNGFSANQTPAYPRVSARRASSTDRRGSMPPDRRTLSFGRSVMGVLPPGAGAHDATTGQPLAAAQHLADAVREIERAALDRKHGRIADRSRLEAAEVGAAQRRRRRAGRGPHQRREIETEAVE